MFASAKRSANLTIILFVLLLGLVWVYAHPPLALRAAGTYTGGPHFYYEFEVENRGMAPVVLDQLIVEGSHPPDAVAAIKGPLPLRARRSAVNLENLNHLVEVGPVSGWTIPGCCPAEMHALRVIWHQEPPTPRAVAVTYRYRGLPFRLEMQEGSSRLLPER